MAIVYETIVKQDLDLGTGRVPKTNPGGGSMLGDQINLATFAFASASQSWTPGVVAIGATATVAVSVKGVVPGDYVIATLASLPAVAMLLYAIAGTDAVNVFLGNGSGVPQTIPAGTLKIAVFKTP